MSVFIKTGDKTTGFKGNVTAITDHNLRALTKEETAQLIESMIDFMGKRDYENKQKSKQTDETKNNLKEQEIKRRDKQIPEKVEIESTTGTPLEEIPINNKKIKLNIIPEEDETEYKAFVGPRKISQKENEYLKMLDVLGAHTTIIQISLKEKISYKEAGVLLKNLCEVDKLNTTLNVDNSEQELG